MQHIKNANATWTRKSGYSKKVLATPEILKHTGLLVQELEISPGQVAKYHYHKRQTEIFYFLNTVGEFWVNGANVPLDVGDLLVVEPNDKHEVRNTSTEPYRYVAFKFNWVEDDYFED
jgi:mannose-6-phosphate isomerase-like protein (cupin superfamily)